MRNSRKTWKRWVTPLISIETPGIGRWTSSPRKANLLTVEIFIITIFCNNLFLLELIEIENRLEARLRREWDIKDDQSPDQTTSSSPVAIQQMLQREIKIVTKNDNDYEWYDWTLIGLIAGISCLLMVIALFGCVQKSRKSKKAELPIKNAEEGVEQVVRLKVSKEKDNDKDGIANENVNNKYAEKIKTIFVNLK